MSCSWLFNAIFITIWYHFHYYLMSCSFLSNVFIDFYCCMSIAHASKMLPSPPVHNPKCRLWGSLSRLHNPGMEFNLSMADLRWFEQQGGAHAKLRGGPWWGQRHILKALINGGRGLDTKGHPWIRWDPLDNEGPFFHFRCFLFDFI